MITALWAAFLHDAVDLSIDLVTGSAIDFRLLVPPRHFRAALLDHVVENLLGVTGFLSGLVL